jgi:hypothetical protein
METKTLLLQTMVPLCTEVIIVAYFCTAVAVKCVTLPVLWVKNYVGIRDINFHIDSQQHKGTKTTATPAHKSYCEGSFTTTTSTWFWVESFKPCYSRVSYLFTQMGNRGRMAYSVQNIDHCFTARVPQKIIWGTVRNHRINTQKFWNTTNNSH